MARSRPQIPEKFESIEQIQNFWDKHSTSDYWDEMQDVELQLSPALKAKLELRKLYHLLDFTAEQIAEIEARARREKVNSKELIRRWILQHV